MILNPKYAPVLILTLNRDLHFKNCVESLSKCLNADKTDLFIALDYPLNDSHYEGFNKIIKIIDTISGFKTINIIRRDVNYGIPRNFEDAMDKIFSVYDRVILSEDDNIFSSTFLNFVNGGLERYETRKDIFSVSGYNYPYKMPKWYREDAYLRQDFTGWGVGLWKDKWHNIDTSIENFNDMFVKNYTKVSKYYKRALSQLISIKDSKDKNTVYVNYNVVSMNDGLLLLNMIDKTSECLGMIFLKDINNIIKRIKNHLNSIPNNTNEGGLDGLMKMKFKNEIFIQLDIIYDCLKKSSEDISTHIKDENSYLNLSFISIYKIVELINDYYTDNSGRNLKSNATIVKKYDQNSNTFLNITTDYPTTRDKIYSIINFELNSDSSIYVNNLNRFIKFRNNIIHPKTLKDYKKTSKEENVEFLNLVGDLITKIN